MSGDREAPFIARIEAFPAGEPPGEKHFAVAYLCEHARVVAITDGVPSTLSALLSAFVSLGLNRGVAAADLRGMLQACENGLDEAAVALAGAQARDATKQ